MRGPSRQLCIIDIRTADVLRVDEQQTQFPAQQFAREHDAVVALWREVSG